MPTSLEERAIWLAYSVISDAEDLLHDVLLIIYKKLKLLAALVTVFIYGSFCYRPAKGAEIHLNQIVAQMTNAVVLKAIELSARDSKR